MASLPSPTTTTTTTTAIRTTVGPNHTDSSPKPPPFSPLTNRTHHPTLKLSCQATRNPKVNPQRRSLLIGLATLCGTSTSGFPLLSTAAAATTLPQSLDSVVRTRVARPAKQRSQREKENEEEVLVVSLEQLREDKYVKFDVYINDDYDFENKNDGVTRPTAEYAGSFVSLPSPRVRMESKKTALTLALTQLIDDIGADADDYLDVVLVPKAGKGALVVKNVNIEFLA